LEVPLGILRPCEATGSSETQGEQRRRRQINAGLFSRVPPLPGQGTSRVLAQDGQSFDFENISIPLLATPAKPNQTYLKFAGK
jgi:hypothetical protein